MIAKTAQIVCLFSALPDSFLSFIQQTFTEHLICTKEYGHDSVLVQRSHLKKRKKQTIFYNTA